MLPSSPFSGSHGTDPSDDDAERGQGETVAPSALPYEALFLESSIAMCVTDRFARFREVNRAFCSLSGWSRDDLIGQSVSMVLPAKEIRQAADRMAGLFDDGQEISTTWQCFCHDGRPIEVRTNSRLIRNAGDPLVLCSVVDVTDRMEQRQALEGAQARLAESERLLLRAQEVARMGHWRVTLDSHRVTWSDTNYRLHGLAPGSGMTVERSNDLIHPEDRGRINDHVMDAVEAGSRRFDMEYRIIGADDILRYVRTSAAVETDGDGRPVAIFGITQDVTDRVHIEQELRRQKHEAEAANKAKSDFLANMSHELRTPLNAILGFSELMSAEMLGPLGASRYRDYASTINESGKHLLTLINDILDMSKIEAGRFELDICETEVRPLMQEAVRLLSLKAEQAEVTLKVEDKDCFADADPRALKQVLINLLSNAIKFTLPGGRVTLRVLCGRDVVIEVEDTGVGIASSDIDRILEPFGQVQSPTVRSQRGTGLGLPLSKRLVELMAGTLEIESRVGAGTTVRVHLPACKRFT